MSNDWVEQANQVLQRYGIDPILRKGDRVKVRGIVRYEGTVDMIDSNRGRKTIITVDLDNGMTLSCFEEELTLIQHPSQSGDLADLVTVAKTAFSRHLNVIDVNTHHVGNIVHTERGYEAYRDLNGEDEFVGVRDSVESAMLLILPFVQL